MSRWEEKGKLAKMKISYQNSFQTIKLQVYIPGSLGPLEKKHNEVKNLKSSTQSSTDNIYLHI